MVTSPTYRLLSGEAAQRRRTTPRAGVAFRLLWILAWAGGCGHEPTPGVRRVSALHMGTTWEISVVGEAADPRVDLALSEAMAEVERIEGLFSEYRPDSHISRINAAAGGEPVLVEREVLDLLHRTISVCVATGGLMDPTFLPLGKLWDWKQVPFQVPDPFQVARARDLVDCRLVEMDDAGSTVRLPRSGMGLGLGAVAKGYAVDRASQVLARHGFRDGLVNGGGDVLATGRRPDGAWRVGIQDPRGPRGDLLGYVEVSDKSLVTSGDYERFTMIEGRRVHHILDPRTGEPAQGVASVSVLASTAEVADGLATALLVAGRPGAGEIRARFPDCDMMIVSVEQEIWMTPGFESGVRWMEGKAPAGYVVGAP